MAREWEFSVARVKFTYNNRGWVCSRKAGGYIKNNFGELGVPVNEMYSMVHNFECRMDKNCVIFYLRVSVHLGSFKRVCECHCNFSEDYIESVE